MAERLAREMGAFYVNQFANPANPLAHETTTAPEIWQQTTHELDAVVVGVGSGGTLGGREATGGSAASLSDSTRLT